MTNRLLEILGLIPEARAAARLAEAEAARRDLQVQIHEMRSEMERLREDARDSRVAERAAYQMMVNVHYQQRYGGWTPFPEAPHIPAYKAPASAGGPLDDGEMRVEDLYRAEMERSQQEFAELLRP